MNYVWLDCDPGHDDAMAILLAGHSPCIELLGISTVAGNQTLEKVTQNALDIVSAAGLSCVGVVAGQAKPLMRSSALLCPEIHGGSGLDGPQGGRLLPLSSGTVQEGKACIVMFEAIKAKFLSLGSEQKIRLVCIGALTNAAMLLLLYPEVICMIDVVIMGGCLGIGNTGPVVEFNIQVDPEAAKVVFESGVQLTMVPLEVTHTVLATPQILMAMAGVDPGSTGPASGQLHASAATAAVQGGGAGFGVLPDEAEAEAVQVGQQATAAAKTPFRHMVVQLLLYFAETYRRVFGFNYPPLHDPTAVAYVIAPELFKVQEMRVDIEVCSALSAGQTVCDRWQASSLPKNCRVALQLDVPAFWDLMLGAVAKADEVSPLNSAQR